MKKRISLKQPTYCPNCHKSEGQALTRHIVAPDIQIAAKLADENKEDLELAKVELIEKEVVVAVSK